MKKSEFRFIQPYIINSEFALNEKFENADKDDVDLDLKINKYTNYDKQIDSRSAIVGLSVEIGKKEDKKTPFFCKVSMESKFEWDEGIGKERIEVFLGQNAPALLIGYIRPVIAYLTQNSLIPTVNIPLINFEGDK